jgi:predicted dehydrogenase
MIRLAVIGTNWITEKFIEAALLSKAFQLTAVYSRQRATAEAFAAQYDDPACFDDLAEFAASPCFDAVYVASPNSLHCPHTLQLLAAGKHVICEKPLGSNLAEVEAMYQCARERGVVLFEAFKTAYLPNFRLLAEQLPRLGQARRASFSYCQFSSRWPKYLAGEQPNTFNPALFGAPERVTASGQLLETGVDIQGTVLLHYPDFEMVISHSKVSDSFIPSEIQGSEGAFIIEHLSESTGLTWIARDGQREVLTLPQSDNSMIYEATAFAAQITAGQMDEAAVTRSIDTARVITQVRHQVGVRFPADQA